MGAIVTLLPSGRVMTPPPVLLTGWLEVAMVPSTIMFADDDLELSAALVAVTDTV